MSFINKFFGIAIIPSLMLIDIYITEYSSVSDKDFVISAPSAIIFAVVNWILTLFVIIPALLELYNKTISKVVRVRLDYEKSVVLYFVFIISNFMVVWR